MEHWKEVIITSLVDCLLLVVQSSPGSLVMGEALQPRFMRILWKCCSSFVGETWRLPGQNLML